jgi:cytochrome c556
MRHILLRTILSAAVLVVPGVAVAGITLSPIMASWNHSKRKIDAMLGGQTPYDEAQIRQDLQRYIASSSTVARSLGGGTAEARDFAARFKAFASDSRTALGSVSQPATTAANFNRVASDCQACHAIYDN